MAAVQVTGGMLSLVMAATEDCLTSTNPGIVTVTDPSILGPLPTAGATATFKVPVGQTDAETEAQFEEEATIIRNIMSSGPSTSASTAVTRNIDTTGRTPCEVSYEIIPGGSRRGADKLIDSLGFSYTLKRRYPNFPDLLAWRCSVRNDSINCPATVTQKGNVFTRGQFKHTHAVGQRSNRMLGEALSKSPEMKRHSPVKRKKKAAHVEPEFRVIKEGSRSGLDILKDKYGYSYGCKKVMKGGTKRYWNCSTRNKTLRCAASVNEEPIGSFERGKAEHSHMPGKVTEKGAGDFLSTLHPELNDDYDSDSDDISSVDASSNTPVLDRSVMKEGKRKDHFSFLGPNCTINLTKCDDTDCGCKAVHCPFCDKTHFKPAKASRVQDHLELSHFAHGVQYDDLMIVKCFQKCSDRDFGHYHCLYCIAMIMKRNSYARHMIRHLRRKGIPDSLLVLPDAKFPDTINAYGFEIPVCKKKCEGTYEKHFHCPQCERVCRERSVTVNHLWRCLQSEGDDDMDETPYTIDESELKMHYTIVKSFKDIPLEHCTLPNCCGGKFHCDMCPTPIFQPTYRQHLVAHLMSHWKTRVFYKGYNVLRCFHACEEIPVKVNKKRHHYHCPLCTKLIHARPTFIDHLTTCHYFKYGETVNIPSIEEQQNTEDALTESQELAPLSENVQYMETRLVKEATHIQDRRREERIRERQNAAKKGISPHLRLLSKIKKETGSGSEDDMDGTANGDLEDDEDGGGSDEDTPSHVTPIDIHYSELLESSSVVISSKLINSLTSEVTIRNLLGTVTKISSTKMVVTTDDDDKQKIYMLTGTLENLMEAKRMLGKLVNARGRLEAPRQSWRDIWGSDSEISDAEDDTPATSKRRKNDRSASAKSSNKRGSPTKAVGKKGKKGRAQFGEEKFPYPEIKEIIEASKPSSGRGRKRKAEQSLPPPKRGRKSIENGASEKKEEKSTPSRYGTRGIRKDYSLISQGVVVKQEVITPKTGKKGRQQYEESSEEEGSESEDEDVRYSLATHAKWHKPQPYERNVSGDDSDDFDEDEEEAPFAEEIDDESGEEVPSDAERTSSKATNKGIKITGLVKNAKKNKNILIVKTPKQDSSKGTPPAMKPQVVTKRVIVCSPDTSPVKTADAITPSITPSSIEKLKEGTSKAAVPIILKVGARKINLNKNKPVAGKPEDGSGDTTVTASVEDEQKKQIQSLNCSLCDDYVAENFAGMTEHLKLFHHFENPPRCDICELVFDQLKNLNSHLDRKHGPRSEDSIYRCETCNRTYTSFLGYKGHVSRIHPRQPVPALPKFQCDKCPSKFSRMTLLQNHMAKHSESSTHLCTLCSKEIKRENFIQHLETHKTPEERAYRYICPYCGMGFLSKTNFTDHQNKHTGNKPHRCDQCDMKFGFRSMLVKHKAFIHSTERPHVCQICMKSFKFRHLLSRHMTKHTNSSKHVCDTCHKRFSTASTLKSHRTKCKGVPAEAPKPVRNVFQLASAPETRLLLNPTVIPQDGMTNTTYIMHTDHPQPTGQQMVSILPSIPVVPNQQISIDPVATIDQNAVIVQSVPDPIVVPELVPVDDTANITETQIHIPELPGIVENVVEAPALADITTDGFDTSVAKPMDWEKAAETEVYVCSECNSNFSSFPEAENHIVTVHGSALATE